jgi:hypothetical protein
MATFAQRIEELIGSDYTTIAANSHLDLFNAAVSEVADTVPSELLLKYAADPINLNASGTTTDAKDKKILLVTRLDASGGVERECTPVSIKDFSLCKDSGSIYFATKHTPVYGYVTDGGTTLITVSPTPTNDEAGKVYYYGYPAITDIAVSAITAIPDELEQAIILKACINILNTYVSDFVQDDEDQELQTMINAQMQALNTMYTSEMSRYMEQDATPRGE